MAHKLHSSETFTATTTTAFHQQARELASSLVACQSNKERWHHTSWCQTCFGAEDQLHFVD